jgi:hypothetical protein
MSAQQSLRGEHVFSIEFLGRPEPSPHDKKKSYVSPYIPLHNPLTRVDNLEHPNEVVLSDARCTECTLLIDYPLGGLHGMKEADGKTRLEYRCKIIFRDDVQADRENNVFVFPAKKMTRSELAYFISARYHQVYKEEKEHIKRTKNARYGIWGHELAGLVLGAVAGFKQADGTIVLRLAVD